MLFFLIFGYYRYNDKLKANYLVYKKGKASHKLKSTIHRSLCTLRSKIYNNSIIFLQQFPCLCPIRKREMFFFRAINRTPTLATESSCVPVEIFLDSSSTPFYSLWVRAHCDSDAIPVHDFIFGSTYTACTGWPSLNNSGFNQRWERRCPLTPLAVAPVHLCRRFLRCAAELL